MDGDLLGSVLLPAEDRVDDDLFVKGLPQLCTPCATITVTNKHVLKKAPKKLGVVIHGFDSASLGGDDIAMSVVMDVPAYPGNPLMKTHRFYGEWGKFHSEAKESACMAALAYLKEECLIKVNDVHFAELEECKKKYKAEHFWSSMLYDRVLTLQKQLFEMGIVKSIDHMQQEFSDGKNESTPMPQGGETSVSLDGAKKQSKARGACRKELFPQN